MLLDCFAELKWPSATLAQILLAGATYMLPTVDPIWNRRPLYASGPRSVRVNGKRNHIVGRLCHSETA